MRLKMLEIIGRRMSGPGKAGAIQPMEARRRVFAENPNKPLQRDWLLEVTAHRAMDSIVPSTYGLPVCAAR
jgi:hypothetical protein